MSLLGNLVRELTKTASNVSEALIHGATDITEVVTGSNQLTKSVRETGVGVVRGVKSLSDKIVDAGEEIIGINAEEQPKTDR